MTNWGNVEEVVAYFKGASWRKPRQASNQSRRKATVSGPW